MVRQRENDGEDNIPKSFNEKFCKKYFLPIQVRESYFYYTEYIFSEFDPDVLCKKFKLRCCRSPQHSPDCYNSWNLLKFYVQNIMITNLGADPWLSLESTNDFSSEQISSKVYERGIDEIMDVCSPGSPTVDDTLNFFKGIDEEIIDTDMFWDF